MLSCHLWVVPRASHEPVEKQQNVFLDTLGARRRLQPQVGQEELDELLRLRRLVTVL